MLEYTELSSYQKTCAYLQQQLRSEKINIMTQQQQKIAEMSSELLIRTNWKTRK